MLATPTRPSVKPPSLSKEYILPPPPSDDGSDGEHVIVDVVGSNCGDRSNVDGGRRRTKYKHKPNNNNNNGDHIVNSDQDDEDDDDEEEEEENQPGAVRVRGIYAFDDDEDDDTTFVVDGGTTTGGGGRDGTAAVPPEEAAPSEVVQKETTITQAELAPDVNGLIETAIRDHDSWRDRQIVVAEIVATTPTPPMIFLKKENLMLPKFNSHEEEVRFQVEHAMLFRGIAPYVCQFSIVILFASYIWDIIQPDSFETEDDDDDGRMLLLLVYGVIFRIGSTLSVIALWILSTQQRYKSYFLTHSQFITVVMFSITTIGNSCILYIHKDAFLTSNAFVGTCIMASSTLGMLRFHYCILYCGICLVCINVAMILQHFYHNQNDQNDLDGNCYDLKYTLLNTNFFLILFVYFSFFFCYVMELHLRQRYRDTGTIFRWTTSTSTTTSSSSTGAI